MKYLFAFGILYCMLHGAQAKPSAVILPRAQMVDILVALELAQAMAYENEGGDAAVADQAFQENVSLIYQAHGIEPTNFQASYLYYLDRPELMQALYELVIAKLEELLAQVP